MRIIGTVSKWNDDRGFGFITPNQIGDEVFVHISAFPRDGKRPTVGETVSFEIAQVEGKPRALHIQRPSGFRKAESRPAGRTPQEHKSGNGLSQNLIALALVATAGYIGYSRYGGNSSGTQSSQTQPAAAAPAEQRLTAQPQFRCDGRQHCSQMGSYEEAQFFNANCPNTKMDGDGDGLPCEDQYNRH